MEQITPMLHSGLFNFLSQESQKNESYAQLVGKKVLLNYLSLYCV